MLPMPIAVLLRHTARRAGRSGFFTSAAQLQLPRGVFGSAYPTRPLSSSWVFSALLHIGAATGATAPNPTGDVPLMYRGMMFAKVIQTSSNQPVATNHTARYSRASTRGAETEDVKPGAVDSETAPVGEAEAEAVAEAEAEHHNPPPGSHSGCLSSTERCCAA